MSFEEIQFPADISYGANGGPMFMTDVVATLSGHEQRNSKWAQSRAKYNVASGVKTETQWHNLIAFFRARKGKAVGFRFKDWSDYKAENVQIGVGDDSTTDFQLIKLYSSGSVAVSRDVTKPVAGTIDIYVDAVLQSSGVSVDTTTGIVTFDIAPVAGDIISADFEFDVPVRFDTDEMAISMDSFDAGNWSSIPLIEVRI
ncbi:MAG: DUF2460 domain-containing protein [Proteobacteria bacterium]|nr:DUF2460 domain-containing protein [Pseudomonadota bacterium]